MSGDAKKECCKQPENLYRRADDPEERADLVIMRCKVCGCRHFEMGADPINLGLKGN